MPASSRRIPEVRVPNKNVIMPYIVTCSLNHDAEEPVARFTRLNEAREYVEWRKHKVPEHVLRVRRTRSAGTLYSAGGKRQADC